MSLGTMPASLLGLFVVAGVLILYTILSSPALAPPLQLQSDWATPRHLVPTVERLDGRLAVHIKDWRRMRQAQPPVSLASVGTNATTVNPSTATPVPINATTRVNAARVIVATAEAIHRVRHVTSSKLLALAIVLAVVGAFTLAVHVGIRFAHRSSATKSWIQDDDCSSVEEDDWGKITFSASPRDVGYGSFAYTPTVISEAAISWTGDYFDKFDV